LKLRELETNRSLARSETAENLLQPPPTTKSALPLKGSIIDRLQHGGGDYRRPATRVNKINTTVSYDLGERVTLPSYQHTSFERKSESSKLGSIDRLKERTTPSLTPGNPALAAILANTVNPTLDTFRPTRKQTPSYKYNV